MKREIILPETLDGLPSVAYRDRLKLPRESGVYFVLLDGEALYIGSSYDIRARWRRHGFRQRIESRGLEDRVRIAWIEVPLDLYEYEKACINKWVPPFGKGSVIIEI